MTNRSSSNKVGPTLPFQYAKQILSINLPDWKEKQEPSSESIIRGIDTQVAELNQLYESKTNKLQRAIGRQRKDVKEIQQFLEQSSKQSDERATNSAWYTLEVLKEMNIRVDDMEKKIDDVESRCQEISTLLKQLIESTNG